MILIVSTSREKARQRHKEFIQTVQDLGGLYTIVDVSYTNLTVDTDDDLRFMFVDSVYACRFKELFNQDADSDGRFFEDYIDVYTDDEFFDELIYVFGLETLYPDEKVISYKEVAI